MNADSDIRATGAVHS